VLAQGRQLVGVEIKEKRLAQGTDRLLGEQEHQVAPFAVHPSPAGAGRVTFIIHQLKT
jgi:hypothetical protein